MKKPARPTFTRRDFGRAVAVATTALGFPLIVPARVLGADAPSERLRIGQIGCGRIARSHDIPGTFQTGGVDIVAVCDVDSTRTRDGKALVEQLYRNAGRAAPPINMHQNYLEVVTRKDIDAVVISTPDHSHAELALAAVLNGKDVYLQKPFTITVSEGILLRDAVARTRRIVQVGSQQRSWEQFRRACELVRSGRIGGVRRVEIGLPIDPTKPDDPPQPIPANLDYDKWLGPAPFAYYTEQRVHPQNGYDERPGWLHNESFCLGMITGWGSHHYDTLHWALDVEHSGPKRIEGRGVFPTNTVWNVHGEYHVELVYPDDIIVTVSDKFPNGLKFYGDDGWIWVTREGTTTSSDPTSANAKKLPPLDASDPRLLDEKGVTVQLPRSTEHHADWIRAVRTRSQPIAPALVGHRSNSACIVSWIAMKLGRPLTWDPQAERFIDDEEANSMLSRPERAPYGAHNFMKMHRAQAYGT
ncbi:MAG: Gfo/Idh/MocA family oxidoreductase [Gammaproteobacteria bacterium]|nr:oxidoreductase [Gammaproteobacteria bacterium]